MPRAEHDAEAAAGKREPRARGADPVIAGGDEIRARAQRSAAHDRDRDRRRAPDRFEQRLERLEARAKLPVADAVDVAQREAAAESRAAAVEDDRPRVGGEGFMER